MDNNHNPNDNALTCGLPTDLWRLIADHLATDAKTLALVNRQLLQAWRAGVLGIRIWGSELRDLDFLRTEFGGNRNTALSFPRLRTLALYEHGARDSSTDRPYSFDDRPQPQSLSLSLHLKKSHLIQGVLELAREQPTLASLVTCLSLGNWGPVGRARSDDPVSSNHLAELLAVFPNLEELTVVGIPSLNKVSHESLPRLSKLKRLMLVRCLSDSGDSPSPLTMSCPAIEELTLMDCVLDQGDLWPVMARWPALRKLCVIASPSLDDAGAHSSIHDGNIDQLIKTSLPLETLHLLGTHEISPQMLVQLGNAQTCLSELTLQGSDEQGLAHLGDEHLQALSGWPQLKSLTLMGMSAVSDTGLLHLSQCAGLTELAMSTDIGVKGDGLVGDAPLFPHLKRLTVLRRYGDDFTASGFKALLDNCPNLTHFNDIVLQGEGYELALAEYVSKMQSLIQNTPQAIGQPTLRIRLRDHNMNDRFFIVRALAIVLGDTSGPIDVNLD